MVRGPASRKGERRFVGPGDEGRRIAERPPSRGQAAHPEAPPVREEYPGPQTSSGGEHIEPGQTRPSRRRAR
jgi:hypothetical protein